MVLLHQFLLFYYLNATIIWDVDDLTTRGQSWLLNINLTMHHTLDYMSTVSLGPKNGSKLGNKIQVIFFPFLKKNCTNLKGSINSTTMSTVVLFDCGASVNLGMVSFFKCWECVLPAVHANVWFSFLKAVHDPSHRFIAKPPRIPTLVLNICGNNVDTVP